MGEGEWKEGGGEIEGDSEEGWGGGYREWTHNTAHQPININTMNQSDQFTLVNSARHLRSFVVPLSFSHSAYYCAAVTVSRHYNSVDDVDTLSLRVRYNIPSLLIHYLLLPRFMVVYMWLLLSFNFLNSL